MAVTWVLALVLYAATLVLGRVTRPPDSPFGLVWPAAGVAFCWLWRVRGTRAWWPSLLFVGASVAGVTSLTGGRPGLVGAVAVANAVQAAIAVSVYARRRPVARLDTLADLWWLLLTAVTSSAAGGLIGAGAAAVVHGSPFWPGWGQWTVRSGVSLVVIAAVVFRLAATPGWSTHHRAADRRPLQGARTAEALVMTAALVVGYGVVFGLTEGYPTAFLVLPLSAWFALRRSTTQTSVHVLACAVAVTVTTVAGHGPFASVPGPGRVVLAQLFITLIAVKSLLLALHRDERDRLVLAAHRSEAIAREQADLLSAVFDSTSDGLSVFDRSGTTLLRNRAADNLLGAQPEDTTMRGWAEHFGFFDTHGRPVEQARLPVVRALAGERVDGEDLVVKGLRHPQGLTLNISAHPLVAAEGTSWSGGVVAAYHDVTGVRRAAADVRAARDLFEGVLAAATEQSIIGTDPQGRITVFNDGAVRMLGYAAQEMRGQTPERLHDPAEVLARAVELGIEPGFEVFVQAARQQRHETRQWTYWTKDRRPLQVTLTVTAMRDADGELTGFIGVATDITDQLTAQAQLADSEQVFRLGFDTAPVGMMMVSLTDPLDGAEHDTLDSSHRRAGGRGDLLRVNRSMVEFTGRSERDLLQRAVHDLIHPDDAEACAELLATLGRPRSAPASAPGLPSPSDRGQEPVDSIRCERKFLHADGSVRWGALSATVVRPSGDALPYLLCLVEDVTARREAEQDLAHQALHDGLTELPNRTLFRDRLDHALAAAARDGAGVGVVYVDLDGFKAVNDAAGHAAGDELLRQVAVQLQHCVRPGDTVARLGGDEFGVVCPDAQTVDNLQAISDRILSTLSVPVRLEAGPFRIGASIGIRLSDGHCSAERLLHDADAAMYAAKRAGKNRSVVHAPTSSATREPATIEGLGGDPADAGPDGSAPSSTRGSAEADGADRPPPRTPEPAVRTGPGRPRSTAGS